MSFVPKDVVLLPESDALHPDRWVAMNVFARTCLGIDSKVVGFLGQLDAGSADEGPFKCWKIQRFSNEDGLLADPSRYQRDVALWDEVILDHPQLLALLKAHFIIIDDKAIYRERFQSKESFLDNNHFGNFHQQHGQHMLLNRRIDPAKWWMHQKFSPDGKSVRMDNLYGAVQAAFLEQYFDASMLPGMQVIDLGCGNGIYTNAMARRGATVIGIDPSEEYLSAARLNAVPGASFLKMSPGVKGGLDSVQSESADLIFMSDALLFYFIPFYPGQHADIGALLADIRRILKPKGKFISLEPHTAFFLNPWLGEVDRPYTILTEYMNKWFGAMPPLGRLLSAFCDAGFGVTHFRELGPSGYFSKIDTRGYGFAREFPLWQLIEFSIAGK